LAGERNLKNDRRGMTHATADRSEIGRGGIAGDAGDGDRAAAAERADHAPLKVIK
jgi:hypothetical protein